MGHGFGAIPRFGRRALLRQAGVAAAAVSATGLVACAAGGARAAGAAKPQAASQVTTVYFQVNWQASWNKTAQTLCQEFTDQNFNASHPGVRAIPLSWGGASSVLTQVLAGDPTAPAVVSSCCFDFPIALPMLAALDPFLKQDNVDATTTWSAGQLGSYQTSGGLYGVPAYTASQPFVYDQAVFDDLGLPYPDGSWTYQDATQIWQALTADSGGKHRAGAQFQIYANNFDGGNWLLKGFGGDFLDATRTVCTLDQPGALAAANWVYPLIWSGVLVTRAGADQLVSGQSVMFVSAGSQLLDAVQTLGTKVKWDVLPMPAWPVKPACYVNVDYYAMNGYFRNQALAWELFQFVAGSKSEPMNRFLVSATLSFPNLSSMWTEWEAIVRATAPMLATKHIEYWAEQAVNGYGIANVFPVYDSSAAYNLMAPTLQQIWSQKVNVTTGYTQMAQQINALQQTAAAELGQAAALTKQFSVNGRSIAEVPTGV